MKNIIRVLYLSRKFSRLLIHAFAYLIRKGYFSTFFSATPVPLTTA